MSTYYNYYLGFIKDDKVYLLGPYNYKHKLSPVLTRSAGFASDLHEDLYPLDESCISDELREEFEYEDYKGEKVVRLKMIDFKDLPDNDDFIKSGYFLIEDIERYKETEDCWDLFYDHLEPWMYAEKLKNELLFGHPKPKYDCEGEELEYHGCADYMYFCYPDYYSKAYEIRLLKQQLAILRDCRIQNYVVLMTED